MTRTKFVLAVALAAVGAAAVAPSALWPARLLAADYKAPRTSWGEPDLQGVWSSTAEQTVPFERDPQYGDRQFLTDAEFEQRLKRTERQLETDNAEFNVETADTANAGAVGSATSPPPHWLERSETSRRTSSVIDPPNGRLPDMTPEGRQRAFSAIPALGNGPFDGPEQMSMWVRCVGRGVPTSVWPTVYNANTRIMQGPGYAAITYEMIHDTRVVPISTAPHPGPGFRAYFGDSRAHWDGDTLVVDVTNFNGKMPYRGSTAALHLVEKYRRIDRETMRYEVTVEDPHTWTRPWTAALDLKRQPAGMFEYACHEGNYSMLNILTGSRKADKR